MKARFIRRAFFCVNCISHIYPHSNELENIIRLRDKLVHLVQNFYCYARLNSIIIIILWLIGGKEIFLTRAIGIKIGSFLALIKSDFMKSLNRILILIFFNVMVATTVILTAGYKTTSSQKIDGAALWRSKNCAACHSVFGLGGHIGPDLTNTYGSKETEYIDYVLTEGVRKMPNFELSETERAEFIKYLKHINSLGEYPLKSLTAKPFGNYND